MIVVGKKNTTELALWHSKVQSIKQPHVKPVLGFPVHKEVSLHFRLESFEVSGISDCLPFKVQDMTCTMPLVFSNPFSARW